MFFSCRDYRPSRTALFDGIEEGGIRATPSYASHEIDEHDNDRALDGLEERVNILKRVSPLNEISILHLRFVLNHLGFPIHFHRSRDWG